MAAISDRQFAAFMKQPEYETKTSFVINEHEMTPAKTGVKRDVNVNLSAGEGDD